MKIASLMVALSIAGAGVASAQSMNVTRPKAAAQKAAAATNEHTRRMTAPQDSTGNAAQASQSSPSPDAPQATQGRATTQASAGTTEAPSGVANFSRESFRYARSGRRDPFVTLMAYGELRPLITELRVTSIAFDPMGGSVAVLRDLGTKEQYRVRVGESLGRMRVASIAKKAITFTIEEFGYSRQETLALVDPKKESSQ
jgi:hypothetical protein